VATVGRNHVNGTSDSVRTLVFGTVPQALDSARRVKSVVLPQGTDRGVMHIFDVALTAGPALGAPATGADRIVPTPPTTGRVAAPGDSSPLAFARTAGAVGTLLRRP
jgi:hypothetical protein